MKLTKEQILAMPKLELHVHLESTIDGMKLEQYAAKQGKQLPRKGSDIYNCSTDELSSFLEFLDMICSMVGDVDDLKEIAKDFSLRCREENIIYAETILNPTHWPQFSDAELIAALEDGFAEGEALGGAKCMFMLSLDRNQSREEAFALVKEMTLNRTSRLAGLSIDGNEQISGRTGEKFAPAFKAARDAGFHITVHAGESSGPEGVADALDFLQTERLDHGVRAAEDALLTERLIRENVPLNICLTSNLTLLYRDPAEHPLRSLWDNGAVITLNRDDPTFLGLTLTEELFKCAEFAGFTKEDLVKAQKNAVQAAFCGEAMKAELLRELG